MDYKEKLEEAKKLYAYANAAQKYVLESLFPELAGSEDEMIKKSLIDLVINYGDRYGNKQNMFAWLEKQGESYTKKDVDDAWLKGMCDAKRELEKQAEVVSDKDDIEAEEKGIRKAFDKIWEEKQDKQKSQRMISAKAKEALYDKPAEWREEDEKMVDNILTPLATRYPFDIYQPMYNWLKSLKDRVQPKQEWGEEDENRLSDAIFFVREYQIPTRDKKLLEAAKETEDWLKSLKKRIGG